MKAASELPPDFALASNYPNPFNPASSISYSLPRSMHVRLSVYDALGRLVATLADGLQSAGAHQAGIDATGRDGLLLVGGRRPKP